MRAGVRDFVPKTQHFLNHLVPVVSRVLDQVRTEHELAAGESLGPYRYDCANETWLLITAVLRKRRRRSRVRLFYRLMPAGLEITIGRSGLIDGSAGVSPCTGSDLIASSASRVITTMLMRRLVASSGCSRLSSWLAASPCTRSTRSSGRLPASSSRRDALASELFSERFLIQRSLLRAIDPKRGVPPVLLIDELDRADEPFEAFLLEVLSEFQITIPEVGTIKAATPPIVVLTSNRTREIHDAVKRRCLYHWVAFPDAARELLVLQRRVPGVAQQLAQQIVAFVQRLRQVELYKQPGIAETIEWARALMQLDALVLDPAVIQDTLGVLLKYQDDIARMQGGEAARLLEEVRNAARAPV